MRRVLVLAGVIGLLVALAVPAHATKPDIIKFEDGVDELLVPFFTDYCGFNVYLTESVKGIEKEFFDQDGEFVRATLHIGGTAIWSSDTTTLPPEHWAWNGTFDPADESFTERGNFWNVHSPGGPILIESGRVIFGDGPPMTSGQFPTFEDGGFDPLCDALMP